MTVHFVSGDLFLTSCQTLAHGISAGGRMGAGIAVEFKVRSHRMFKKYKRLCHRGELCLGDIFLWKETSPWMLNMVTQGTLGGATEDHVAGTFARLAAKYEGSASPPSPCPGSVPGSAG